jgi:hypothetical protein
VPRLLESEEIRAGLRSCLGDPWLVERLMQKPETAIGLFRLFAFVRLYEGCTHGGLAHRALEDLIARGADFTTVCESRGLFELSEAAIREVARNVADLPEQPAPAAREGLAVVS